MSIEIIRETLEKQRDVLSKIDNNIENLTIENKNLKTRVDELEKLFRERRISVPGLEDYAKNFSFTRAIKAIITNDFSEAPFEKEVFEEARKKTMTTGTMGFFVPVEILQGYIELLRAEAVVIKMGATVLENLTGIPVVMPKLAGGASTYWVGEDSSITASDLTSAQLSLTPKKVGALCALSNTLLKYSNPSIEEVIRRDFFQAIALAIDLAALKGSGSSYQPLGIANTSGINTVSASSGLTFDVLYNMQYELQKDNAYRGKLGFIFHPAVKKTLVQLKVAQFTDDTGGMYVIQPMLSEEQLKNWIGDYAMTTQIEPTTKTGSQSADIFFGNWQELIIAMWGGLEIRASQETSTAFASDQTWIRVIQEVDIGVRHAASFCYCSDASVTA